MYFILLFSGRVCMIYASHISTDSPRIDNLKEKVEEGKVKIFQTMRM